MDAAGWIQEIEAAEKREKRFRKSGQKINDIYAAKEGDRVPFNILYSNTETMLPSLYSAIPRPVVERRFKDDDPTGKAAAEAGKRVLEFLLDTNVEGYETYDEAVRAAVLDSLLPGRGVTSIKYDAQIEEPVEGPGPDGSAAHEAAEGEPAEAADESAYKSGELVCTESRKWDRYLQGYATKWSKVPWIAFMEDIDKPEAERLFGEEIAVKLQYYADNEVDEKKSEKDDDDKKGPRKTTRIYVIWAKEPRKVIFLSKQIKDAILKETPDPLEVTGFFPIPKPITLVEKANDLTVTALYDLYQEQATELNDLTRRIKKIVHAIKARGIYDSELGSDLQNLMTADDNELVPADKSSSLAAEKGLQNAIWFMPIEQLVMTLQQLLQARESCKAVIWEIMGIADIMRGQSNASETLGAQQIKQSWGSLRLKRMQKEVMRYCRDLLRLMLEVAAKKFSEETWAKMTGLPYLTEQQFMQAQQMLQALQQQMAMMPPPQPGQPPQPNPLEQQMQQVQAELQKPKWADVLSMLRDDMQRAYRIDIETNSTVEPEAAEDQKNIAELMNSIAQFLNGVGPLIEQGVMPFQAAQAMLLAITRRYRFGSEIEDQIRAMKEPQKPDPAAEAQAKSQAELQKTQMELQAKEKSDQLTAQADEAAAARKHQMEQFAMQEESAREAAKAQQEATIRLAEIEAEKRVKQSEATAKANAEYQKAQLQAKTELEKAAMQVAGQVIIAKMNAQVQAATAAKEGEETAQAGEKQDMNMQEILKMQQELLAMISAPVEHKRGPDGRIIESVRKAA